MEEGEQMRIRVGKYYLNSDKWNWWITEVRTREKGKNVGEEYEEMVTGYCWTFERACQTFVERTIEQSEATTLSELLTVLQGVYDATEALVKAEFDARWQLLKEISEDV